MREKGTANSKETLVSNTEDQFLPAKRVPQYLASLAATIGSLGTGFTLGWSSSAGSDGKYLVSQYGIPITPDEFSWIGSLCNIGSAVSYIPIGFLADFIGRKTTMLSMVVPFVLGWLLIIFACSVPMFYIGRLISGIGSGCFCVVVPLYTAEISQKEIRGALGSYFQLLLCVGILLSYVFGTFVSMKELSIISAVVPIIFFVVFVFMPESPVYYLKRGNDAAARRSLIKLRGARYDVDSELRSIKEGLEESSQKSISFLTTFKNKATVKAYVITDGLMILAQLNGVNSVIFYASDIFERAGSSLNSSYCSIIVAVILVIAVFISTLVVDRLGRRILLLLSIIFLFLGTFVLGVYFYLLETGIDVSKITWLPLLTLCVFVCLFNFGMGPVPWMMLGEMFAPEVKGVAASIACVLNAVSSFIVTKFYTDLKEAINVSGTFWIYSGICFIGILFVYFVVPETKGKSLEQIQRELDS